MKSLHIAYTHRTDDVRIYRKECCSLAQNGYEVIYVTSDKLSKATYCENGIKRIILPLRSKNRFLRIIFFMKDVNNIILKEKPDVCHIHDFQIILLMLFKSVRGRGIFDSHEDFPVYLAETTFKSIKFGLKVRLLELIEYITLKKSLHVIAATPHIQENLKKITSKVTSVNNYPPLRACNNLFEKNNTQICFTGGAGVSSGLLNVAEAIKDSPYQLVLAGNCDEEFLSELEQLAGHGHIKYMGYLSKDKVDKIIETSIVGIVTYLPTMDCIHALPNKMFEYLERGTPIIYSNFDDWVTMLDDKECGLAVNPYDPKMILKAIDTIASDKQYGAKLSANARLSVEKYFNWSSEEKKLLTVYENIRKDKANCES